MRHVLAKAKAGIWREASCCGDNTTWIQGVVNTNRIAAAAAREARVGFVRVFDLYGLNDLARNTIDGKHATPENYHRWTSRILMAVERKLRTGCLKGLACPDFNEFQGSGFPTAIGQSKS